MSTEGVDVPAILSTAIRVIAQTFVYGTLVTLMPLAFKALLQRGSHSSNRRLFWLTVSSFILSTVYWALSVAYLFTFITGRHIPEIRVVQTTFNSIVLINFLFADGVVVWRMQVLCASYFSRKVTLIPFFLFGLLSLSVMVTIILRIVASASNQETGSLFTVTQASSNALSLATNLAATSLIFIWVSKRRKSLQRTSMNARVERMMTLLVESGIVYCVFTAVLVIVSDIHIPLHGSIIDIYKPVHAQIAGMYPAFVVILVHDASSAQQSSFYETSGDVLSNHVSQVTSFVNSQAISLPEPQSHSSSVV